MRSSLFSAVMAAAVFGLTALPAPDAWAARKHTSASAKAPHAAKHRAKRERHGSGETAAERDRRLQRECKGLPNAGACLGYAN